MHQLQVNPDGSERLEYTMKGLPVRISTDRLRFSRIMPPPAIGMMILKSWRRWMVRWITL